MKRLLVVLLTILTLSVVTLVIIELSGVSKNALFYRNHENEGYFYSRDGQTYHGEIIPDARRTRDQIVHDMPKTTMQFYETKYNFRSVSQGIVVKHSFRFKNTGTNPLMIAKTDVTCGCTVSNFPQEAVPPGAEGEIGVEFNTTGKYGLQQKSIVVHSNSIPEAVSLGIEADVK